MVEALDERAQRPEIGLGERPDVVGDVGEADRPPDRACGRDIGSSRDRDLLRRVAPRTFHDAAVEHQQREISPSSRILDLGVRGAALAQIAPKRSLHGDLRGPRYVLPRQLARVVGLLRQAEHALAEDVAHHVRRAALDRVRLGAQEAARRCRGCRPRRRSGTRARRRCRAVVPPTRAPDAPSRSMASFWRRWLYSACMSFVIDPSGPASAPRLRLVGGALVVEPDQPALDVQLRQLLALERIADRLMTRR